MRKKYRIQHYEDTTKKVDSEDMALLQAVRLFNLCLDDYELGDKLILWEMNEDGTYGKELIYLEKDVIAGY